MRFSFNFRAFDFFHHGKFYVSNKKTCFDPDDDNVSYIRRIRFLCLSLLNMFYSDSLEKQNHIQCYFTIKDDEACLSVFIF